MFADQSGFYLLPMALRTYAPAGQTPVVKEYLSHDRQASLGLQAAHNLSIVHRDTSLIWCSPSIC